MKPIAPSAMIAVQTDVSEQSPVSEMADFDGVVGRYWPRIFRFLLASLRDRDAAESLTQDCLMRAYLGRHRFRGDSNLHTWLTQIAINLARDFARNRRIQFWKRTQLTSIDAATLRDWLPGDDTSPEAQAVAKAQLEAVWRVSAKLSERQRTVFLLRFVEDMDLLEIAEATGLKEGAVKVHLFRAIHRVRERIGEM